MVPVPYLFCCPKSKVVALMHDPTIRNAVNSFNILFFFKLITNKALNVPNFKQIKPYLYIKFRRGYIIFQFHINATRFDLQNRIFLYHFDLKLFTNWPNNGRKFKNVFELINIIYSICIINKLYKQFTTFQNLAIPGRKMSEHETGRFNFPGNINDAAIDSRNSKDSRHFSFGQPSSQSNPSSNIYAPAPTQLNNQYSFGPPMVDPRLTNNLVHVRTTNDARMNSVSQNYAIPPLRSSQSEQSHPQYQVYTVPPPPQQQQQPNSRMNIMHRPDVHSGNFDTVRGTHHFPQFNNSLQTIKQERSSMFQSRQRESQQNIRGTQGYNLGQIQMKEYEREKQLQKQAKCCFCFKK